MPEIAEAPAVAAPTPTPSNDEGGISFASLEAQAVESDGAPARAIAAKPPEPPKPAPTKEAAPAPAKEVVKPAEKPAEVAAPKPAETPTDTAKPKTAWQLVREKEKELGTLREQHAAAQKELADIKAKPPTPADDPEKTKLTERLGELESEIRFVNYEKSTEFKEKYQQPYLEASKKLTAEALELMVENADGSVRQVTTKEFWGVVTATTLNDAVQAARAIFPDEPDKRNQLISMRKEIKSAWDSMESAKTEYRTKGAEREKQAQAQEAQKRTQTEAQEKSAAESRAAKWAEFNDVAVKNPNLKEFFTAADDDAKGKELLTKGLKSADRAFGIGDRDTEGNLLNDDGKPLNEDEVISLHSAIRNKAGAFNYVAYRYRLAQAQNAELQKQLEQYKKSEPAGGEPTGGTNPEGDGDSMETRLTRFTGS